MKRILVLLLMMIAYLFVLTGCSKQSSSEIVDEEDEIPACQRLAEEEITFEWLLIIHGIKRLGDKIWSPRLLLMKQV